MRIRRTLAAIAAAAGLLTGAVACSGGTSSIGAGGSSSDAGKPSTAPSAGATATASGTANDGIPAVGRAKAALAIEHATASGGRTVALTFDDGPNPVWTPRILALLGQYHAHATFCEVGPNAQANPGVVKQIVAAGDRLCDHSVHHNEAMHKLPPPQMAYEITGALKMIQEAGGPGTQVDWFRAPGGDFTPKIRQISSANSLRPLGWTVDTRDWARPGVPAILNNVRRELRPGGIVLMHDAGGDRSQTLAALKILLPWLVKQGYAFDFPGR